MKTLSQIKSDDSSPTCFADSVPTSSISRSASGSRESGAASIAEHGGFVAVAYRRHTTQNVDGGELKLPDHRLSWHALRSIELGSGRNLKGARSGSYLAKDGIALPFASTAPSSTRIRQSASDHPSASAMPPCANRLRSKRSYSSRPGWQLYCWKEILMSIVFEVIVA